MGGATQRVAPSDGDAGRRRVQIIRSAAEDEMGLTPKHGSWVLRPQSAGKRHRDSKTRAATRAATGEGRETTSRPPYAWNGSSSPANEKARWDRPSQDRVETASTASNENTRQHDASIRDAASREPHVRDSPGIGSASAESGTAASRRSLAGGHRVQRPFGCPRVPSRTAP